MIVKEKNHCCGCTACANVCPRGAITMKRDKKGFQYPYIDKDKCVDCGLCNKVCQFGKTKECKEEITSVYAAKRKKDREQSQSGGAFTSFAETILSSGGVVYGVMTNSNNYVLYSRIDDVKNLQKIKGSKYVQASVGDVFRKVKEDLIQKKKVLFSGTPCYVDGLIGYIELTGVDSTLLYTCDLVCHGVPSPLLYKQYLNALTERYGKVSGFNFRDKYASGWYGHIISFKVKGKRMVSRNYADMFYSHLALRDCCYYCPYANLNRVADLTVGDYWGIEKAAPEFADTKGSSLVIINTEKGLALWKQSKDSMDFLKTPVRYCIQPTLKHPSKKPKRYDEFWESLQQKGFEKTVVEYCDFDWKHDQLRCLFLLMRKIKSILEMD